jgi:hypothetical protein
LGDKREISAIDNDARIRFLYPFRDPLRDDMVGDDIMLLRIDRKVPERVPHLARMYVRMKLYFNHIHQAVGEL